MLESSFKPEYKWWQTVLLYRRLAVILVFTWLNNASHLMWAAQILLAATFLITHLMCNPYARAQDNLLETISLITIMMLAVCSR
jgi:hypothetical protein